MARMIGERVRWLDGMIRTLEGGPARRRALTNLIARGTDIMEEAELRAVLRNRNSDPPAPAALAADEEAFRRRESEWNNEVENVLAGDDADDLQRFSDARGIPSTGHYAVHNRLAARLKVLREIRDTLE